METPENLRITSQKIKIHRGSPASCTNLRIQLESPICFEWGEDSRNKVRDKWEVFLLSRLDKVAAPLAHQVWIHVLDV